MLEYSCSVGEAALRIGIGRTKLYGLINDGTLATVKIGRRTLVKTSSLRALVDEKEAA